jgi:hypothetical protein
MKLADLTEEVNKMAVENAERYRLQAEEAEAEAKNLREMAAEYCGKAIGCEAKVFELRKKVEELEKPVDGKFFAYNATEGDFQEFDSFEAAADWIKEFNQDSDFGVSEEFQNGDCFIGKITHRSKYTITDRKENYCQKVCEECPLQEASDCGHERWPFNDYWEYVGDLSFEPITELSGLKQWLDELASKKIKESMDSMPRSEEAPPDERK